MRCKHCYIGDRLERGLHVPFEQICSNLLLWRKMGGSKLTILGGEATLHKQFEQTITFAHKVGYEKVILTTNALRPARKKLMQMDPKLFSYVQVSLDGDTPETHNLIRGPNMFESSWETTKLLCALGFDTRLICTVNKVNIGDCLNLLTMADEIGVSLVKFHVFSEIGIGNKNAEWALSPLEWIEFYKKLDTERGKCKTQIWYQPTYALKEDVKQFNQQGYYGCIGRTLDRISIFPDGRAYICSFLFDTNLNFANIKNDTVELNKKEEEKM